MHTEPMEFYFYLPLILLYFLQANAVGHGTNQEVWDDCHGCT